MDDYFEFNNNYQMRGHVQLTLQELPGQNCRIAINQAMIYALRSRRIPVPREDSMWWWWLEDKFKDAVTMSQKSDYHYLTLLGRI